jgi:formate C-acetyltransferase
MDDINPKATASDGEQCWRGFELGRWSAAIDVRDFIVRNVAPYTGDESFPSRMNRNPKGSNLPRP